MSFKNRKRDDHGHVIGNDEVDGQECKHVNGGSSSPEQKLMKNKNIRDAVVEDTLKDTNVNQNAIKTLMDEAFDDDYDEEFDAWDREHMDFDNNDARPNHTKLNDLNLSDSELWNMAYQYIGNDKLEKLAESLDLDSPQDLTTNDMLKAMPDDDIGDMMRINGLDDEDDFGLEDAVKNADDDVLDEQFGKDTPERKLVGAIKEGKPEDFAKKTAKMPNGKEMSLFDFAHNIVNYLDTDTAAYIIASKYGVSEADAKAYLESPYNTEGDYKEKLNASNKKQKYRQINGQIYPVDANGKINRDNKFPDLKSFKDVYGENVEEDK